MDPASSAAGDSAPIPATAPPAGAIRAIDAGLAAFAATTGALLVFGHAGAGTFTAFAIVGRRVARDIVLSTGGDVLVGLMVHLGESMVLGALTAAVLGAGTVSNRLRAALAVVLLWELAPLIGVFAALRADVAADLSAAQRVALALVLVAALALAPRGAREDKTPEDEMTRRREDETMLNTH